MMKCNDQCKAKLDAVIKENAGTRVNGRVASERTYNARKESLHTIFNLLPRLGFKLQVPNNIAEKHVHALVQYWLVKRQLSPKTIEGHLSNLRIFCEWIGKNGLVKSKYEYVDDTQRDLVRVRTAAVKSKSWSGNAVDVIKMIHEADQIDFRLGLILRLELGFGLRLEEALKCDPHSQDFIHLLAVLRGHGKGSKQRNIFTLTSAQRELLDYVKSRIPQNEKIGWTNTRDGEHASLKQNKARYFYLMRRLGITKKELGVSGHGLRAQFAENHGLVLGLIAPSMGGSKGQYPKPQLKTRLQKISEALGHNRTDVMTAYTCSFGKTVTLDRADRCMCNIDTAVELLRLSDLDDVGAHFRADCTMVRDTLEILDVEITLKQVQHLWKMYSARNGVAWVKPDREIGICIESSALAVIGSFKGEKTA